MSLKRRRFPLFFIFFIFL